MRDYIQNKISAIKENGSYGVIIEVGAGLPTYNELCKHPNTASKIVHYAKSPNSWEYNKKYYNHKANFRAISPQVLDYIILQENKDLIDTGSKYNSNFYLVSTVQIANDRNTVSHGWFTLCVNNKRYYYHYTINLHQARRTQLSIIAKIGLDILASNNDISKLDNGYIDKILDEDFNELKEETLTCLINGKLNKHHYHNTNTIFTKENNIERLNDFLRKNDDIIVFKGSFNPIHQDHLELVNKTVLKYNAKPILSISVDNRDPNKKIDVKNLVKRIELINSLGYDVLIDVFGLYHYSYVTMIQNTDFKNRKLYYILGGDIVKRFLKDEDVYTKPTLKDISSFNGKWDKCYFLWFNRADISVNIDKRLNNIMYLDKEPTSMSSTHLRELITNKNKEELIKLGYNSDLYFNFLD